MEKVTNFFFFLLPELLKALVSVTAALILTEESQFVIALSGLHQISLFLKKTEQK